MYSFFLQKKISCKKIFNIKKTNKQWQDMELFIFHSREIGKQKKKYIALGRTGDGCLLP